MNHSGKNPMGLGLAIALVLGSVAAWAQDIKIAHVYDKTGPLEAYAKQTQTGLMMGLNYGTKGTMMINGHKLVVIEKDDQGKPDVGKSLLTTAFADDKADIAVGATSSGVALAMLPVAEEYKKILLVEPAVADSITGDKWNRYIFRTGRNSSQDAISNAVALDKKGTYVATLAQDYAFGKDFVKAFRGALKNAKLVHEEYLPANTTDFTAGAQRLSARLDEQIRQLKAKREAMTSDTKDWDFAMKAVYEARELLTGRISELAKQTTPETWTDARDKVGEAWKQSQQAVDNMNTTVTS